MADGTCLSQSIPTLNYVGSAYGLRPTDAMAAFHGDKAIGRVMDDYFNKGFGAAFFGEGTDEEKAAR